MSRDKLDLSGIDWGERRKRKGDGSGYFKVRLESWMSLLRRCVGFISDDQSEGIR